MANILLILSTGATKANVGRGEERGGVEIFTRFITENEILLKLYKEEMKRGKGVH